ncbi:hypothetical protein CoNPh11_CDS0011 [Staphylococcus phage S-CoN_Ph11]|nr:hypothetical protein CoNPh11_CDS0011 [Staphylococcus phage S-CoN_Ph11]
MITLYILAHWRMSKERKNKVSYILLILDKVVIKNEINKQ